MVTNLGLVENLASVKDRVMKATKLKMAYLAHCLGYRWCGGGHPKIGEGFIKSGDAWVPDKNGRSYKDYKGDQPLSMVYGNWHFAVEDIKFGESNIELLDPETVDSGDIINNHDTEATQRIERSYCVARSISHTKTSNWKSAAELGISLEYSGFKFSYDKSETIIDSTSNDDRNTFTFSTTKTLKPFSAASWKLMVTKTKKRIPYKAIIIVKFWTEFQGQLRYGGGYNGHNLNFHNEHRGSDKGPTFNYRFGDSQTPFYTALKQQSDTNSDPWMWNDMKQKYSDVHGIIGKLCDERRYVFDLTGSFQDVEGKKIDIVWEEASENVKNKIQIQKRVHHLSSENI